MNSVTDLQDSGSGSNSSWEARIAAARGGSREAQGWLFAAVRAYLRSIATQRLDPQLRVKASPSDLVQETLLEAHRHFDRFAGESRGELVVWLQGILNNRVLSAQRAFRETAMRDLRREVSLATGDRSDRPAGAGLVGQTPTPSAEIMRAEDQERLNNILAQLPPRYEQVIRLRNELKLSFREVATAMSCSPAAAQKLWSRAIDRLGRELKADDSQ